MSEEKILTLHPQGKAGVNILKRRYDLIKDYILSSLMEKQPMTFSDLSDQAEMELSNSFDGKVLWYIVTVKLDLEARGMIRRIPKTSPHQLEIIIPD